MTGNVKTMAIIKDPRFGVNDRGVVSLSFTTYTSETHAALQVLNVDEAVAAIEAYGVGDVSNLHGKPCWVDTSKFGLMTWVGACTA